MKRKNGESLMDELKEIRKRLGCLEVLENDFIKASDVIAVCAFIEGLMYQKGIKDESGI